MYDRYVLHVKGIYEIKVKAFFFSVFCNLSVRHVEKSQASDWPSHTGNHPDA